jgi:hypothetical protein
MQKITPFIEDGIDSLTIDDKLTILCSENPVNTIVEMVNCKNPKHHNILLPTLDSETVKVYDGETVLEVDTDMALALLITAKTIDLSVILLELEQYLLESFVTKMQTYLSGGCSDEPNIRNRACKPRHILKRNVKISDLRKKFNKKHK